ncbi:putative transmembrane GTPase FZO1 [Cladorrhinum sp. PSN259]|nr:putative transmembrane GTPase FZO1 [Cladorrhinum sp. PSN259]
MSQEYFSPKGKGRQGHDDDNYDDASPTSFDGPRRVSTAPTASAAPSAPNYMTVGNGSTSHHAARLQEMLRDTDSGYGGSIADGSVHEDLPILRRNGYTSDADTRSQASAVHQLWYNQHRNTLGRSISAVVDLLKELQKFNETWPATYPSVARAALDSRPNLRPGLQSTYSNAGNLASPPFDGPAPPLRRAMTSLADAEAAESSTSAENRTTAEPRLVTPQIAEEFSVLKLDLNLGAINQSELVHSLEKKSIASLLDGKIRSSIKHLQSLRERIEDTSSKVLVTGDLNAGKSTFCNALLRRKVLPEDQQPCTSIFCEVLDARENCGIEEVHAVHKDSVYDRHDETTYDVFPLWDLEKLVVDSATYLQCKVYVKDSRSIDESLLNNGVVDIALIDAPGLNMDTTKTTAIFARQEEIDVVVFVVSAMNHFTQTSTEFIRAAAAEKAYLFIVVNGFDAIRDKDRCRNLILKQIGGLSPATYKESGELVHFVSSSAIPVAPSPPGGPGGGGSGGSSGSGFGDDPGDDDPKGKGKDKEMMRDFSALEQSLRRFVLEKRARSKLAPAKTYLRNILNDVNSLATVNTEVAQAEYDRVANELRQLEPQLESRKRAKLEVSEKVDRTIEETCKEVYDTCRATIGQAIDHAGQGDLGIPYPGVFGAFQYADELKEAMLSQIANSVAHCEELARKRTVAGVNVIKQLGILHVGDQFHNLSFKSEVMFQGKKDALARQVDIPTEFWDFVDWSTLMQKEEKAGMALTVAGVVGTGVISSYGQVNLALRAAQLIGSDNLRPMIIPGLIAAATAVAFYILNQIPHSLPHRLSQKISVQLAALDYVHTNSSRISGKVRKVLQIPASNLKVDLDKTVEQLGTRRDETVKVRKESHDALKYFTNLVQRSAHQRQVVDGVDLDSHPPGMAGLHH